MEKPGPKNGIYVRHVPFGADPQDPCLLQLKTAQFLVQVMAGPFLDQMAYPLSTPIWVNSEPPLFLGGYLVLFQ